MKKIINSIMVIFLICVLVNMPNVYAENLKCNDRKQSNCDSSLYGLDPDGNTCQYNGSACETIKYGCGSKKHCTCYDAGTCPTKDSYGNKCQTRLKTGDCIVEPSATEVEKEGDIPTFLEDEETTSCGKIKNIPKYIPFITSLTVTVLTIISMGMLVIMGTIDLFKGTVSGKDDEIKKNQKAFVGRLTSAIIIFLLVALTKLFIGLISNAMGTTNGIASCIDLFINNR